MPVRQQNQEERKGYATMSQCRHNIRHLRWPVGSSGGRRPKGVAYTPSYSPVMGSGYSKVCKQMVFASTMPREGLSQKCQPSLVPTAGMEFPSMMDLDG